MEDTVIYNPVFEDDESCCPTCEDHEYCMQVSCACERQHSSDNVVTE